jgi:hypothetical protein
MGIVAAGAAASPSTNTKPRQLNWIKTALLVVLVVGAGSAACPALAGALGLPTTT